MLETIEQRKTKKADAIDELTAMRNELIDLANAAKANKIPVIITIDGWSSAGKGSQIAKLIKYMDPRFTMLSRYARRMLLNCANPVFIASGKGSRSRANF